MSDIQTALRETARKLLEEGTVTCVIGWGETRFPDKTIPLFVKRPKMPASWCGTSTASAAWPSTCWTTAIPRASWLSASGGATPGR